MTVLGTYLAIGGEYGEAGLQPQPGGAHSFQQIAGSSQLHRLWRVADHLGRVVLEPLQPTCTPSPSEVLRGHSAVRVPVRAGDASGLAREIDLVPKYSRFFKKLKVVRM